MRLVYDGVVLLASLFYYLLWFPKLTGRENFPSGPYLICANHRSWFDPPLVAVLTSWRPIGFLAKSELFANPLFGWLIRSINARPIRRGVVDRSAAEQIQGLLNQNIPVLTFPEGTRSKTGRMQPPKPGIGRLVRMSGAPVVPVYIHGSLGIAKRPFLWGRLGMRAGPAITIEEIRSFADDKDGYRALSRLIMQRICALSDNPRADLTDAGL